MNHQEQIARQLRECLDALYDQFSNYPCPPEGIITCLDYGPTEEEAIALAKPLKEIPQDYIRRLEFYDEWGTIPEVKYLTPRILEYYVKAVESKEYSAINYSLGLQFIRYKLKDLDETENSKWTRDEATCIRRYLLLFHEYLSLLADEEAIAAYLDFTDALCDVIDDIDPYITIWQKVPNALKSKQIEEWLIRHINPDTLELIPSATTNQNKIKSWVLSEENITNHMDLFAQDPWWKLALK